MQQRQWNRREVLRAASFAAGAGIASVALGACSDDSESVGAKDPATSTSRINDIDHVVIFFQENRPFDRYFGARPGVRGFADTDVPVGTNGGKMDGFGQHMGSRSMGYFTRADRRVPHRPDG